MRGNHLQLCSSMDLFVYVLIKACTVSTKCSFAFARLRVASAATLERQTRRAARARTRRSARSSMPLVRHCTRSFINTVLCLQALFCEYTLRLRVCYLLCMRVCVCTAMEVGIDSPAMRRRSPYAPGQVPQPSSSQQSTPSVQHVPQPQLSPNASAQQTHRSNTFTLGSLAFAADVMLAAEQQQQQQRRGTKRPSGSPAPSAQPAHATNSRPEPDSPPAKMNHTSRSPSTSKSQQPPLSQQVRFRSFASVSMCFDEYTA